MRRPTDRTDGCAPVRDYAAIGDCHGSALVARDGSIDWCCLRRFDADPVFSRLLDASRGGYAQIRPEEEYRVRRCYVEGTNILRTTFAAPGGRVAVTDFMPVGRAPGASAHDYTTLRSPSWLVRIIQGIEGRVRLRGDYVPGEGFTGVRSTLTGGDGLLTAEDGTALHSDLPWKPLDDAGARCGFELAAGERKHMVVSPAPAAPFDLAKRVESLREITRAFWEEWSEHCRYSGPYEEMVSRSSLALKLLTYAPTGAIVAAPTTSLPEEIGGTRNWDYRYCWLRDATFSLYALAAIGYSGEADDFSTFLLRASRSTHPDLQLMYGIQGEHVLEEREWPRLDGYRGSRPVRTGNAAYAQRQLDPDGEIMDWAHLYRALGGEFSRDGMRFLEGLLDQVARRWREPGHGIWEMRTEPIHHVYGKILSWVAADRSIRIFGPSEERLKLRREIREAIMENGIHAGNGHLQQAYERPQTDAALLRVPVLDFPLSDEAYDRTVRAIQRELQEGPYVRRYRTRDGLPGEEGAFLICSFWLVDALLFTGHPDEARSLFEDLLQRANDVGLYAEQIDPGTDEFLGNFPQAFTHLALIQSASFLARHREHGIEDLRGTHADRGRRAVRETGGLKGVWRRLRTKSRRAIKRLFSSTFSVLPTRWSDPKVPDDWRTPAESLRTPGPWL